MTAIKGSFRTVKGDNMHRIRQRSRKPQQVVENNRDGTNKDKNNKQREEVTRTHKGLPARARDHSDPLCQVPWTTFSSVHQESG